MKTPKTLTDFATRIGAYVEPLNFRLHGRTLRGYAVVDADNNELLEIEPVYYSNGDRWKINLRGKGLHYLQTLRRCDFDIRPGYTGFKFSGMTGGSSGKIITPIR